MSSADSRGLSPAAGSSRQSSFGSVHIARAISSRRCAAIGEVGGRIVGPVGEADLLQPVLRPSRAPLPCRCDSASGRRARRSCSSRRASACCAGRRRDSRGPSCRRTGGCSGRSAPPCASRAISKSGMRSSRKDAAVLRPAVAAGGQRAPVRRDRPCRGRWRSGLRVGL